MDQGWDQDGDADPNGGMKCDHFQNDSISILISKSISDLTGGMKCDRGEVAQTRTREAPPVVKSPERGVHCHPPLHMFSIL